MIVYDLQAVQSRSHGERGIARYCLELAQAIERIAPGRVDRYIVNPNRPVPDTLEPLMRSGRVARADTFEPGQISLLHVASPIELDVPLDDILVGHPQRVLANLYDLIPLVFDHHYLADPFTSARYRARIGIYLAADFVLTDSQSAADDAVRMLGVAPERCVVLGAGTSEMFRPAPEGRERAFVNAQRAVPQLRPGFVMLPSGIDWRKNIEGVLAAYARLPASVRRERQLVLVCRISQSERATLESLAARLGCADSFVITGFVTDEVLVLLNQSTDLVVFPSRYEGFGLPVLEARRCGAPVICGDNSSLREVQPDATARFDVDDVDSLVDLMLRVLTDRTFADRLRSAEVPPFTWERAARITLDTYERALSITSPVQLMADRRPRIAYVTPLPPAASGIATYSYHLLERLADVARVRAFSEQVAIDGRVPTGVAISPIEDLHAMVAAGQFDHVVYAIGNNELHRSTLRALEVTPGHVHLHDVRLTNCYATDRWPEVVERHYPGRFTTDELAQLVAPWSPLVQSKNVLLLADVCRLAQRVFVHSRHAMNLVSLDVADPEVIDVGPLAAPTLPLSVEPVVACIASFGIVSPAKQSDKVLAASRAAAAQRPGTAVWFVGEAPEGFGGDDVEVTGFVDDVEFERRLGQATVAVQLRAGTNGESSAAVAGCLAAGIPTIVTDLGSASEFPDDVVVKVPRDITVDDLSGVITSLLEDRPRRERLRVAARAYAASNDFAAAARRLLAALEAAQPLS